jgi:hypothetical protein
MLFPWHIESLTNQKGLDFGVNCFRSNYTCYCSMLLKVTVTRDFRPLVFFIKQSPLGP